LRDHFGLECLGPPVLRRPRLGRDYRRLPGERQPHWQFVAWQRHPFLGHPQEQLAQSHVPQQAVFAAVSSGVFFFWVVIVFSWFLFSASCALKGADVRPLKTLQRCLRESGTPHQQHG